MVKMKHPDITFLFTVFGFLTSRYITFSCWPWQMSGPIHMSVFFAGGQIGYAADIWINKWSFFAEARQRYCTCEAQAQILYLLMLKEFKRIFQCRLVQICAKASETNQITLPQQIIYMIYNTLFKNKLFQIMSIIPGMICPHIAGNHKSFTAQLSQPEDPCSCHKSTLVRS